MALNLKVLYLLCGCLQEVEVVIKFLRECLGLAKGVSKLVQAFEPLLDGFWCKAALPLGVFKICIPLLKGF